MDQFSPDVCCCVCCVFRVLSKFAFSLSQDCELPEKKEVRGGVLRSRSRPVVNSCDVPWRINDLVLFQKSAFLKAEAVDMLIQHHLFSWDI